MRYLLLALALVSAPAFAGNYALVNNGTVVNVIAWDGASPYAPPSGETVVPVPGNAGIGWSYASGMFSAPATPARTPDQLYTQALAAPVVVSCASGATVCVVSNTGSFTAPAIDGQTSNATTQGNITSVETAIAAGRGLPGGGSSFVYFDPNGTSATFNQAQWNEFATAMMNYGYALQLAHSQALAGQTPTWPSNQLTLP
ncbi:hypothetical protein PQR71_39925 [Paraburkholderia fungorum]|uniref:hypothetical protein n=1 Tax=Paraburkholderia fungorum TaxID=134537 RepID=UPI0038BA296F